MFKEVKEVYSYENCSNTQKNIEKNNNINFLDLKLP